MVRLDFLLRVGVLLLLAALIFAANPNFGKIGNLVNIIRQASIIYLLGIGMTLVIIVGGIDLSNGAVLAFSSCIFALAVVNGVPIPVAMLIAIGHRNPLRTYERSLGGLWKNPALHRHVCHDVYRPRIGVFLYAQQQHPGV